MLHFTPTGHFFFLLHRVARVGRFFARWLAATRWPKRQNGSNVRLPEISRRSERRFGLDLSPGPISVRCRRKSFVFVETGFGQKPTQDRLDLEPPVVLRRVSPGPEVGFRSWRETSKRNGWGELPATILSWKKLATHNSINTRQLLLCFFDSFWKQSVDKLRLLIHSCLWSANHRELLDIGHEDKRGSLGVDVLFFVALYVPWLLE